MEQLGQVLQKSVSEYQNSASNKTSNSPIIMKKSDSAKSDVFINSNAPQKKPVNKKKLAIILGAIGAAAALAGAIIYGVKTGKIGKTKEVGESAAKVIKELKDIQFDKGVASLKESGEKFTGELHHTLKNGDNVVIEYLDGVIQKSTRSGEVNFEKIYETIDGIKKVKKIVNGVEEIFNITQIKNDVIQSQLQVRTVMKNKDLLSSEDFSKQASEIKYKSKSQADKLAKIVQEKQQSELASKMKLEAEIKAKYEAELRAKIEAEVRAQIEAEKLAGNL